MASEESDYTPQAQYEPMTREELVALLDDVRAGIEVGDSFEGSVEYLMPGSLAPVCNPCEGDGLGRGASGAPESCPACGGLGRTGPLATADFAVRAAYRVGNLQGQGGICLFPNPSS